MANESSDRLAIVVSRHSAFYSPLIAALARGFLAEEGFEATYATLKPGQTSRGLLATGRADVTQSAVGSNWGPMEKGETDLPVHFAQINTRDGFFLAFRKGSAASSWKDLEGLEVLADHGRQPLLMLRYAAAQQGVDWERVQAIDRGAPDRMIEAFRAGEGEAIHLQGPAPQQLVEDGVAERVLSVGAAMPENAFSSLSARRDFVESERGRRFTAAYRRSREWVRTAAPSEVATAEAKFFPDVSQTALAASIEAYQQLGCWQGGLAIPELLYRQSWEVFRSGGAVAGEHAYGEVVAPPPGDG